MFGENITLGIIIGAALADSINPCVLGVLIFLLLFLNKTFKSRRRMLVYGLAYSLVVYITYLALGFGILKVALFAGISSSFYWAAAIVAIIAGLLEIKDFFWYGRGISLKMIPGAANRLKSYTKKIEQFSSQHSILSFLMIGVIGVFVVLVELPCTGAPYFAVLALLAQGDYSQAVPYLLLYNFVFILPLFVVITIAYLGHGEKLEEWRMRNRGLMRLVIGLFLVTLGAYMIYTIVSPF